MRIPNSDLRIPLFGHLDQMFYFLDHPQDDGRVVVLHALVHLLETQRVQVATLALGGADAAAGLSNRQFSHLSILPDYPLNTYTYTLTDNDGYEIEYTLKIGSWIKASDADTLTSAWGSVGGKGSAPNVDSFNLV